MSSDPQSFDLFTSLRYDPLLLDASWNSWADNPPSPLFLLPLHLDRLLDGAQRFQWPAAIVTMSGDRSKTLARLRSLCEDCAAKEDNSGEKMPLRIRITLNKSGELSASAFPTPVRPYDILHLSTFNLSLSASPSPPYPTAIPVFLDSQPTPSSLYTSYKTTHRPHYDAARSRAGLQPHTRDAEVLLYDSEGYMSEGSIRNVAFWREGRWVSPVRGGLKGTVRRWMLEKERAVEGDVRKEDVVPGEVVLLSNGVEGCVLGVITGLNSGAAAGDD
ncbi:aminotransferase [Hysterangium stoloniferum]|nr:aminotransferase [Hysterangium stoloniferum]